MTSRRQVLAGLAAVAAGAGITTAAAVEADRPAETAMQSAITAFRAAWGEHVATSRAAIKAEGRVMKRRGKAPPKWEDWLVKHHPTGPYLGNGDPAASPARSDLFALLSDLPLNDRGGIVWKGAYAEALAAGMVSAEAAYYAPIRPIYDAIVDQFNAGWERVADEENLADMEGEADAAFDRMGEALAVLLEVRPRTAAEFVAKVQAVLINPDDPIGDNEVEALRADVAALTGKGGAV